VPSLPSSSINQGAVTKPNYVVRQARYQCFFFHPLKAGGLGVAGSITRAVVNRTGRHQSILTMVPALPPLIPLLVPSSILIPVSSIYMSHFSFLFNPLSLSTSLFSSGVPSFPVLYIFFIIYNWLFRSFLFNSRDTFQLRGAPWCFSLFGLHERNKPLAYLTCCLQSTLLRTYCLLPFRPGDDELGTACFDPWTTRVAARQTIPLEIMIRLKRATNRRGYLGWMGSYQFYTRIYLTRIYPYASFTL